MELTLPTAIDLSGTSYAIRWEFREILALMEAWNDPELSDEEKTVACLYLFYVDVEDIPNTDLQEAVREMVWFVNGGSAVPSRGKKLMDWEQDFPLIVGPVNRVIGHDVRGPEKLHWWSFLGAYYEIGDCLFAQVVRIRGMKARGQKLDKSDREFANQNAELIMLKTNYTEAEEDILAMWGGMPGAKH